MLLKQDILERKVMALQQLVRDLANVKDEQQIRFQKTTYNANKMPTIMEEEEDHTEEDEQHTSKDEEHNVEPKKKSKPFKHFMKMLRAIFKRSK